MLVVSSCRKNQIVSINVNLKVKQYLKCIEKLQLVEALKQFHKKHKHQTTRFNGSFLG